MAARRRRVELVRVEMARRRASGPARPRVPGSQRRREAPVAPREEVAELSDSAKKVVALSPQAQAIIAALLDPEVRELEQETGESHVFASREAWDEVEAHFPSQLYRERVSEEGVIE